MIAASAMSWRCRRWSFRQAFFTSTLPLLLALVAVQGLVCTEADCDCKPLTEANCTYGVVNISGPCACCPGCRSGPGEECNGPLFRKCALGYICEPIPALPGQTFPNGDQRGLCVRNSSNEPSPSPSPSPDPTPTQTPPTPIPVTTDPATGCRQKCSVEFCSGEATGKARICSAQDSANQRVEGRGRCQHTSCRSCFLLVEPQCVRCDEPPSKKCLRGYYGCIRDHYFRSPTERILLPLEDPAVQTKTGQVVCHVPAVSY